MMPPDLPALLARLEGGGGADRELDGAISRDVLGYYPTAANEVLVDGEWMDMPEYTASIDAATALADSLYGRARAQAMLRQAAKLAVCDLAVPLGEAVARALCAEVVRGKVG